MKIFCTQMELPADSIESISTNSPSQGKLFVAYLNRVMIDYCANEKQSSNEYNRNTSNNKVSVFSTSNGSYYIDGVLTALSQDDEMMAYETELAEYY